MGRPGGGTWQVSDLNGLEVRIRGYALATYYVNITQVYVRVNFSPNYREVTSAVTSGFHNIKMARTSKS
jgi:hypothetical protein